MTTPPPAPDPGPDPDHHAAAKAAAARQELFRKLKAADAALREATFAALELERPEADFVAGILFAARQSVCHAKRHAPATTPDAGCTFAEDHRNALRLLAEPIAARMF